MAQDLNDALIDIRAALLNAYDEAVEVHHNRYARAVIKANRAYWERRKPIDNAKLGWREKEAKIEEIWEQRECELAPHKERYAAKCAPYKRILHAGIDAVISLQEQIVSAERKEEQCTPKVQ